VSGEPYNNPTEKHYDDPTQNEYYHAEHHHEQHHASTPPSTPNVYPWGVLI